MTDSVRIDKYLWAIRVYKTRSEAAEACKGSKVKVGGVNAKPARAVSIGELIEVRKAAVHYTFKVKALPSGRVGAKLVEAYAENLTPEQELRKLQAPVETVFLKRDRGAGRPTKKDRREIDGILDAVDYDFPEDVSEDDFP